MFALSVTLILILLAVCPPLVVARVSARSRRK
jgi:hypothetical protein